MAYVNITNRFTNQQKRYAESVVMTCPAVINEGGGRANIEPTYIGSGDAWTANIVEADTIGKKVYLIIDEAFPTGTTISVDIAGTAFFTDAAADAVGTTVSTVEDTLWKNGQTITTMAVNGAAGSPITEGVARVVIDSVSLSLNNGNYAEG